MTAADSGSAETRTANIVVYISQKVNSLTLLSTFIAFP
jgi:hypothetical protein